MFGVCQALGEDFRFNPLLLRLVLAVPLIWYPTLVLAVYATLAAFVVLSRLIFPNPRPAASEQAAVEVDADPAEQDSADRAEPLPIAA
jgi:phage shock protein PspC (stress-responsive transcriptional regulator)